MKSQGKMRPKAVLMLLTNAYDPDPRVRQEALALIGMGCRVRLLAWDRDLKAPATALMEGVEVERVYLSSAHGRGTTQIFFYAWLYLKMLRRGLRTPFDVVHCHDLDTLPVGFILGKLKRKPIIYDAHESFPDMLEGNVHPAVRRGLVRLENFLIRRVDLLITVGEKLRRHFAERGARRCVVVGNSKKLSEYDRTTEQNAEVRRRLGIPGDALVVVCICQLLQDRQLEQLLDATDECAEVYTIVGGKGILETAIRERAQRNPRILFVGFVPSSRIPSYTCAADIVYYGFDPANPNARYSAPNKLYEALAAGKPIISGEFGEIGDVIHRASCGVLLPTYTAEAVKVAIETLQDESFRSECSRRSLELARAEMNWEKSERTLLRAYSELGPENAKTGPREHLAQEPEGTPSEAVSRLH